MLEKEDASPEKMLAEISQKYSILNNDFQSFIHAVSHYLKSPLTALLGFSSLLKDELEHIERTLAEKKVELNPDICHYTIRIIENARLLEKMINDLVLISRLKRGKVDPVKMEEVCGNVINSLGSLLNSKGISVEVEKCIPHAPVDREHLRRILHGLLSNAVKFSRENSRILVGFSDGEYFVKDEGIGISNSILDRVFTIFFTTCGKESMCTGAGLYIVKRIIELYNGGIRIESFPNRGTTVFFSFPT